MSDPIPVTASLTYDDPRAAIAWLGEAFGFEPRLIVDAPDGGVMHSELSLGDAVVMVSGPRPKEGRRSPRGLDGIHATLCVYVGDPDAVYARAKAAGAEIRRELQDEDYGARGFTAADPEGQVWYFSTYRPGAHWGDGVVVVQE